jgi:hypothetical protein
MQLIVIHSAQFARNQEWVYHDIGWMELHGDGAAVSSGQLTFFG